MSLHAETVTPACFQLAKQLAHFPFLKDFYLVGGTALALQLGHRLSVDLDFFTGTEFNPAPWLGGIQKLPNPENLQVFENNFRGFINGVKVEMMYFAYPPRFPLTEWQGLKIVQPLDIALFKLLALIGRNRKKDIIDLYFINEEVEDLEQVFAYFLEFYDDSEINLLRQVEQLFDDQAIEKSDMPIMLRPVDWDKAYTTVKEKITKAIKASVGIH